MIPADVQRMIDTEGVYLCGEKGHAMKCVTIFSKAGLLWSTKPDEILDPERFTAGRIITGPYWPDRDVKTLADHLEILLGRVWDICRDNDLSFRARVETCMSTIREKPHV